MNVLKALAYKYPIIFSIIIMVFSAILTEIRLERLFTNYIDYQSASYITGILEQGLCSIILIALIASLGLLRNAGFTKPKEWKQLWLTWPLVILSIVNGWSFFSGSIAIDYTRPGVIILFILLYISVGFFEEILIRGLTLSVMMQKWGSTRNGIYLSVVISSLLFGLLHIINFFLGRYSFLAAVTQTIYGLFFGVIFAACLLRNNSIWPVIILHAVFDMCGSLNEISVDGKFGQVYQITFEDALSSIIVTLPLLVYGLFIIRKVDTISNSIEYKNRCTNEAL